MMFKTKRITQEENDVILKMLADKLKQTVKNEKEYVEYLRQRFPNATNDELIKKVTWKAKNKAMGIGAVLSLPINLPFAPQLAMVEAKKLLDIKIQLVVRIIYILDPTFFRNENEVPWEVLVPIFKVEMPRYSGLKKILVIAGMRMSRKAVRNLIRKALRKEIVKQIKSMIERHVGLEISEEKIAGKIIPLLGTAISVGYNYVEIALLKKRTIKWLEEWFGVNKKPFWRLQKLMLKFKNIDFKNTVSVIRVGIR